MSSGASIINPVLTLSPFADKTGLTFYPDSMMFDASASLAGEEVETIFDMQLMVDHKLNAIKPIMKGHSFGDYAYLTIHLPNGTQVLRVGGKVRFDDQTQSQGWIETNYDSHIYAGLILRIHYVTTSLSPVKVIFNFRMHKVTPQAATT